MSDQPGSTNPHRLPRTVVPARYDLSLEPDLNAATFTGTVDIEVDLVEPLDEIVLNAAELEITEATIIFLDGTSHELEVTYDPEGERISCFCVDEPAPAGPATLALAFSGILNDKLRGFYRSTFTDTEGVLRTLATTQFESTDARRAFPCFDEPDFKAIFSIRLVVPDDLLAISNGAEVDRVAAGEGKVAVRFADTIQMSTYLVAFVVGPLEATAVVDVDGVPLRVVHTLGKSALTGFGLDIGASALRTFTEYYGIDYPGDKVDLVAIPDFAFGAMENLGCITFRETALLVDPDVATQPELERVADVVAHELAHMWFGDLVTMRWWNGIWLNEAFATFMEMFAVDRFRPEWQRWSTFALSRSAAFDTDALAATRPIEYPVESPADAEGMFDILTYEKGASVLRMLEQHLGPEQFRDGIRHYLSTHAYANTETGDLWDALAGATGAPVREIAESWIFQGGHPLVDVQRGAAPTELVISQRLFRYLPGSDTATWVVPIGLRWAGSDGVVHDLDIRLSEESTTVSLDQEPQWVIANRGAAGFYRTTYAPDLRAALADVAREVADATERYTLIDDTWVAVLAGSTPVSAIIELIRRFTAEDDLAVWRRIGGVLANLHRVAVGDAAATDAVAGLVRDVVGPLLERLGDTASVGEDDRITNLRATAFELLGSYGDVADVQRRAEAIVERAIARSTGDGDDPSLTDAAVRIVAEGLDDAGFDRFLAASRAAVTPQDTLRYLGALADVRDAGVYNRFLDLLTGDAVRTQDVGGLLNRGLMNPTNAAAAWAFTEGNWESLGERLPSNAISRMVSGVRTFTDPTLTARVANFFAANPVPQAAKAFAQHTERMQVMVAFAQRERAALITAIAGG
ncbi:MAG TPA: M1 family metallopeptidase [Acidimicrobiales bacterium]|nr:M1 family metallopeptidase [Acidimicrobiales bacterium]